MDRIIFIGIALFTVIILGVIIFTSFKTTVDLRPEMLISESAYKKGPDNAKVTIVEFSDFECPFCAQFGLTSDALLNAYPDLRLVYRHFPLPNHRQAFPAAVAAEAAGQQGKFWEYSRELFSNQPNFTAADLEKYANNVKIDKEQFKRDIQSVELINKVKADIELGNKLRINATPTFYLIVDGRVEKVKLTKENDLENAMKKYIQPKSSSGATEPAVPINIGNTSANADQSNKIYDEVIARFKGDLLPIQVDPVKASIKDLISNNKSINTADINLISVTPKDWSDASLGCSKPGQVAIQVITPGFEVKLRAGSKEFNYHTDSGSNAVIC